MNTLMAPLDSTRQSSALVMQTAGKTARNTRFWQALLAFLLCSGLFPTLSRATQSVFDGLLNDWAQLQNGAQTKPAELSLLH